MKYCSKCRINKKLSEFGKSSSKADGIQAYCKECMKACRKSSKRPDGWVRKTANMAEYQRVYREKNRTHLKELNDDWRKKNSEKVREINKKKYEKKIKENPDLLRENGRKCYERKMKRLHGEDYVVGDPSNMKGNKSGVRFASQGNLPFIPTQKRKNCQKKVARALAKGIITKTVCMVCGNPNVEAHHADYDQPLSVVWLCAIHHRECHPLKHVRVELSH